jgi:hypothetical protein
LLGWGLLWEILVIAVWYRISYRPHVLKGEPGAVIGLVVVVTCAVELGIASLIIFWLYGFL